MKQEGLSYFTDIHLTLLAMGLFIAVFAGVVYRTYRRKNRKLYDEISRIPLKED